MRKAMMASALAAALPFSLPAGAAHTVNAIVYSNDTLEPVMVVIPDDDSQLDDPAFNPPNTTQLRVPVEEYESLQSTTLPELIDAIATSAIAANIDPSKVDEVRSEIEAQLVGEE